MKQLTIVWCTNVEPSRSLIFDLKKKKRKKAQIFVWAYLKCQLNFGDHIDLDHVTTCYAEWWEQIADLSSFCYLCPVLKISAFL